MLHPLPIANVHLQACVVAADRLSPVPGGQLCTDCQRLVHDFTQATQTDLDHARAVAPDGRLCGRFLGRQLGRVRPPSRLRTRLRWFLVALVLTLGQGLSAQRAWAQLRQPATSVQKPKDDQVFLGTYIEQMPEPPGGQKGLQNFLQAHLRYPAEATQQGKVFVGFIVRKDGRIDEAHVIKGLEPLLDAEALRVVRQMPAWTPAHQNNRAVDVSYTLPITFGNPVSQQGRKKK